jgi:hypothetical protein
LRETEHLRTTTRALATLPFEWQRGVRCSRLGALPSSFMLIWGWRAGGLRRQTMLLACRFVVIEMR